MRFCCTVSHGKTDPCWEITILFGLGATHSRPSILTVPRSCRSNPAMMFNSVGVPLPDTKLLLTPSTAIFLSDIAPPHGFQSLEQARGAVEHQADHADDDHA